MPIDYNDPRRDVPRGVEFRDAGQAGAWVAACEVEKPWRAPMRQVFVDLVAALPARTTVLELGSGPGFLAEAVLDACPNVTSYTLLDHSEHMRRMSRERLRRFDRALVIAGDFAAPDWTRNLPRPYTAVLAMQAVHEIRHKRHAPRLYREVRDLLAPGGLVAVCDGVPRDPTVLWQVSLCMTAEEQIEALRSAAFDEVTVRRQIGPMILVTGRGS